MILQDHYLITSLLKYPSYNTFGVIDFPAFILVTRWWLSYSSWILDSSCLSFDLSLPYAFASQDWFTTFEQS